MQQLHANAERMHKWTNEHGHEQRYPMQTGIFPKANKIPKSF